MRREEGLEERDFRRSIRRIRRSESPCRRRTRPEGLTLRRRGVRGRGGLSGGGRDNPASVAVERAAAKDGDDAASDPLTHIPLVALEARLTRGVFHLARVAVMHAPEHRSAVHDAVPLVAGETWGRDHQPTRLLEARGCVIGTVASIVYVADVGRISRSVVGGPSCDLGCVVVARVRRVVVFSQTRGHAPPVSAAVVTVSVGDGHGADVCADEGAAVAVAAKGVVVSLHMVADSRAQSQVLHTHLREKSALL